MILKRKPLGLGDGGSTMVRSSFIVVSDDQVLIQKAHQFGLLNGVSVRVMTPSEWEAMSSSSQVSLVPGQSQAESTGAKVLQFPSASATPTAGTGKMVSTIEHLEAAAIENAIAAYKGNLTEAAKALGIGRATLYRKVRLFNIDPNAARRRKAA